MPLETGSFINDLTPTNPLSSDPAGQGDDHLRLLKATVQGTFPQMGAIFGQVRRQDTALSISSTWNTNHFICSASATATVVLTLPPAASITTGFFVDITTIGTGTVNLAASGAGSINGAATLSIPRLSTTRAYFVTGTGWLADTVPHAQGGTAVMPNLAVDGTLSVSGATVLAALTVNGVATMSAAVHMKSTLSVSGQTTLAGLTVAGTATISSTLVLSVGQIKFPAVQNPSSDPNVLDDFEENTWTPVVTFATAGDVSVAYSTRIGTYVKIGRKVFIELVIVTSTFTHTTASGNLRITGLPFTPANNAGLAVGAVSGLVNGSTFYQTQALVNASVPCINIVFNNNSGGTEGVVGATEHTTGVNCQFTFTGSYSI